MTTPNIDTKALRELEAKATPGPWGKTPFEEKNDVCIWQPDGSWLANVGNWGNCQLIVEGEDGPDIQAHPDLERIETGHDANAEFIVALRNAAPALLDFAERAQEQAKQNEELRAIIGENASAAADRIRAALHGQAERDALKAEVERLKASESDARKRAHESLMESHKAKKEATSAQDDRDKFRERSRLYFDALEECCNALKMPQQLEVPKHVKRLLREHLEQARKLSASEREVERLKWALERILIGTAATWVGDECRAALRGEEAPRE